MTKTGTNEETPDRVTIRRIERRGELPWKLLREADPSEEALNDYTRRGACYGGYRRGEIVAISVLLHTRPFTTELVNLAVDERFRREGIGTRMIAHAVETARRKRARVLELGTGNAGFGQLALYQRCGFEICGVERDFFRKYYPEPIFENGVECRHMVRFRMELTAPDQTAENGISEKS